MIPSHAFCFILGIQTLKDMMIFYPTPTFFTSNYIHVLELASLPKSSEESESYEDWALADGKSTPILLLSVSFLLS